jgi:hypothetical protein
VDRHVDYSGNGKNTLAGYQRYAWPQSRRMAVVIGYGLASV